MFGGAEMDVEKDYIDRPRRQRNSAPMNNKNQRRRKQRKRTEQ